MNVTVLLYGVCESLETLKGAVRRHPLVCGPQLFQAGVSEQVRDLKTSSASCALMRQGASWILKKCWQESKNRSIWCDCGLDLVFCFSTIARHQLAIARLILFGWHRTKKDKVPDPSCSQRADCHVWPAHGRSKMARRAGRCI